MSQMWVGQPKEVLQSWLNALQEMKVWRKLSDWEQKFIYDIDWQLTNTSRLSQKQQEVLERIYAEKS